MANFVRLPLPQEGKGDIFINLDLVTDFYYDEAGNKTYIGIIGEDTYRKLKGNRIEEIWGYECNGN